MTRIDHVLIGEIAPLGPKAAPSAIGKRAVAGPVAVGPEGLAGDRQGDRRNHGGPEKAIHHYPHDHYAAWLGETGREDRLASVGAFGENLSSQGLTEAGVAVGDTFRLGTALVQVSQGRQPCWKLNVRFDVPDMASRVQKSGRTGWYYRVLEPGAVAAGDALALVDRLSPEWTIERLWRTLYVDMMNLDELAAMTRLGHLAEGWRRYAERRLASRQVEDWRPRLEGGS